MFRGLRSQQAFAALLTLLLSGGIVVEGLVSVLPHDHAPEEPPQPTLCENLDCSAPASAHWRQEGPARAAATCLACTVPSVVFEGAPAGQLLASLSVGLAAAVGGRVINSIARRWQPRLRAPPQLA
jgi:hypothetical protein